MWRLFPRRVRTARGEYRKGKSTGGENNIVLDVFRCAGSGCKVAVFASVTIHRRGCIALELSPPPPTHFRVHFSFT